MSDPLTVSRSRQWPWLIGLTLGLLAAVAVAVYAWPARDRDLRLAPAAGWTTTPRPSATGTPPK